METAAEFLCAYREQAGLDADDALGFLIDFLRNYGMVERAATALCDLIDTEGMTSDLAGLLQESGLDRGG